MCFDQSESCSKAPLILPVLPRFGFAPFFVFLANFYKQLDEIYLVYLLHQLIVFLEKYMCVNYRFTICVIVVFGM